LEKIEMKKTLVAVAALAAMTGAMADATISGVFQVGLNKNVKKTTGTTTTTTTLEDSNGNGQVNFKFTEDLDGGMKFFGQIGVATSNDYAGTVNGYETFGGFSGGFGSLRAGSFGSPQFVAITKGDSTGYLLDNAVANITQHHGAAGISSLFSTNQIQYTLTKLADGLTLQYTNKLGEAAAGTGGTNFYSIDYAAGGLNAGYVYSQFKNSVTQTDTAGNLYVSYDLGMAKIYLMNASVAQAGSAGVLGQSVGLSVPMGAVTLYYNYSSSSAGIANTARTVTAQKITHSNIGASYAFSKRTTAAIAMQNIAGTDAASSNVIDATSGSTQTKLLVIHAF